MRKVLQPCLPDYLHKTCTHTTCMYTNFTQSARCCQCFLVIFLKKIYPVCTLATFVYSSVVVYVTFQVTKLIVDKFGKLMYNVCRAKSKFCD